MLGQVDHPLCIECAVRVKEEVDSMVTDLADECRAYEEAISRLEQENLKAMPAEVNLRQAKQDILQVIPGYVFTIKLGRISELCLLFCD